jgi:hypothetical protein
MKRVGQMGKCVCPLSQKTEEKITVLGAQT